MASHNHTTILIILSLTLATADQFSSGNDPLSSPATFYDVLTSNCLPIGLFPKGISDFSLDPASGCFQIHLLSPSPCDAKFETRVRYECNITGCLNYGKIANLSGVAAQELFLWLPVKGIQVDVPSSGLIYFDVGVVSKQFSLSFFEIPQDCDAMEPEEGGGGDGVVSIDDGRVRIAENQSSKFMRKRLVDQEGRAVS